VKKRDTIKMYNLPKEVKFCKKCVISNQRPRIKFDKRGVCNACNYTERKRLEIDWEKREEELHKLLDRHRKDNGEFDVICPGSGGKDSAYVAHQLKYKYGMHPLTVTWAPNAYTDVGWKNLQNFIHSGFDNILGTPNGIVHRRMTKIAFEELGDPFQPFIYGQVAFPLQMALKYNVTLIMDGENAEAEYGGDPNQESAKGLDLDGMLKYFWSNLRVEELLNHGFTKKDLYFYFPPSADELKKRGIEHRFFSYYDNWIPQEHFYYAAEHTGFQANPDGRSEGTYSKYASLDDKIDGFHYYLMFLKFGIGRATSDAAHEIRDGHLTREEGVGLVKRYDGEFPSKYFKDFLEYVDLTEDEFWDVLESWRSPHLWKKINGKWKLKCQVE
jgi:N-acetyl sugar amidotransferase